MNFKKSIILQINWYLTPTNSSHSDTLQVKSSILVKQTDLCYILVSVKHLLENIKGVYANCRKFKLSIERGGHYAKDTGFCW